MYLRKATPTEPGFRRYVTRHSQYYSLTFPIPRLILPAFLVRLDVLRSPSTNVGWDAGARLVYAYIKSFIN